MDQRQKKHAARQGLENLWMSDKTHAAARTGLENLLRMNYKEARRRLKGTRDFVVDERRRSTRIESDWRICGGSATKKHAARKGLEDFVADERHGKTLLEAD